MLLVDVSGSEVFATKNKLKVSFNSNIKKNEKMEKEFIYVYL